MTYEAASITANDVSSNTVQTITEEEVYEYVLGVDEFGVQGKLTGTNKDMYRAIAYIFNQKSGVLEHNLTPWYIDDKVGMKDVNSVVSGHMIELTNILQNAGLDSLSSIVATDEGDGQYLMTFNFTNGDKYVVDPLLSAALKNAI